MNWQTWLTWWQLPYWQSEAAVPWLLLCMGLWACLAATVMPLSSELAFVALMMQRPGLALPLWLVATLGNTLGGLLTFLMGRCLPAYEGHQRTKRYADWVRRRGAPSLLWSWVPVLGDGLVLAAGWLRIPYKSALGWLVLGKGLRYGFLSLAFVT